jgi:hypothetical protein
MNVIQLQDMLRGQPDERLKQELSQPTGSVPQYLVLSEVVRRDKMREATASAPQSTVLQDIIGTPQPAQQQPQAFANGGFITPAQAMGNAGVRGFEPQQQKQPMQFGFNSGGPQMFTPNTTPQPPAPVTNNNINVPPPAIPSPAPQFDGGQTGGPNAPSFYEQPSSYANGGIIGLADGGDPRQAFIDMMMPHALRVSARTGVDPRIVISQAALETGYGKSAPGGNYFGIKSHGKEGGQKLATMEVGPSGEYETTDSFRQYGDVGESADDYANFLLKNPRYGNMLNAQGLDAQIEALGESGYATDPKYAAKIRSIASSPLLANVASQNSNQQPSQETAVASIMNPADREAGILSGGVMPDPRKRGIGSFFADAMRDPDAQKDMRSLGASLFAKSKENTAPEAPGITRGDPSLAKGIGGPSVDDLLAQYQNLRSRYMASGGPVRMAGTANSGTLVQAFPAVGRGPSREQAEEIRRLDERDILESEAEGFRSLGLTPAGIEERRRQLEEIRAREAEAEAGTGAAPSRMFTDDFRATPNQLFVAQREGERARAERDQPSDFDRFLGAYQSSQQQIADMYREQAEQERLREQEAGGLPFLLRQLGIGMIATGGPLGEGVRGGLQQAFSAREEQTQAARDRIRELQLKGKMTDIEAAQELSKLRYQEEIEKRKAAQAAMLGATDYKSLYESAADNYANAIKEGNLTEDQIADLRAEMEQFRRLAGIPKAPGGLAGVPSGVRVTRE